MAEAHAQPGALLLLLGVSGPVDELAHHTLLFTEDWEKNFATIGARIPAIPDPASIYVCRPSATDPTVAPEGHENLFVLVPVPAEPVIGRGGTNGDGDPYVEAAADAVIAQLARWCGIPELADRIVVRRTIAPGTSPPISTPGAATRSGSHIPWLRARCSVPTTGRDASRGCTTRGIRPSRRRPPLCLISAEITRGLIRSDVTDH